MSTKIAIAITMAVAANGMIRLNTYKTDPKKKCAGVEYAVKYNEFCCVKNYGKGCSH